MVHAPMVQLLYSSETLVGEGGGAPAVIKTLTVHTVQPLMHHMTICTRSHTTPTQQPLLWQWCTYIRIAHFTSGPERTVAATAVLSTTQACWSHTYTHMH